MGLRRIRRVKRVMWYSSLSFKVLCRIEYTYFDKPKVATTKKQFLNNKNEANGTQSCKWSCILKPLAAAARFQLLVSCLAYSHTYFIIELKMLSRNHGINFKFYVDTLV